MKERFEKKLEESTKKIEEPIKRFEADLDSQKNRIWPSVRNLENFLRYSETIGNKIETNFETKKKIIIFLQEKNPLLKII